MKESRFTDGVLLGASTGFGSQLLFLIVFGYVSLWRLGIYVAVSCLVMWGLIKVGDAVLSPTFKYEKSAHIVGLISAFGLSIAVFFLLLEFNLSGTMTLIRGSSPTTFV